METSFPKLDRRRFLQFGAFAGASIVLAGCGGAVSTASAPASPARAASPAGSSAAPAAAHSKASGTATLAQGVDIETLDPQQATSGASRNVFKHMFDYLVVRDPHSLKFVPALATAWKLVDNNTWQFDLRKGVTFHDGAKFDANAVKATVERYVNPTVKNIYAFYLKPVKEVKIVDDYTVQFITDKPHAPMLDFLVDIDMMSPTALKGDPKELVKKATGSGPFRFVEWVPGDHLTMEANPDYWGPKPQIQKLVWRPIAEESARLVELKSGGADLVTPVAPTSLDDLQKAGFTIARALGAATVAVPMNSLVVDAFKNQKVRQALNYAVNKEAIISSLLHGAAKVASQPFPAGAPGHDPKIQPYPYDPAKAKQLLAEAGFSNGFKVNFSSPVGRYLNDKLVSEAIASDWGKVGVQTSVTTAEWTNFVSGVTGHKSEAFLIQLGGLVPDQTVNVNFLSTAKGAAWEGYNNPAVDKLIGQAATTLDADKRDALYKNIGQTVHDDAPWVFMYHQEDLYGLSKRLKGFIARGDSVLDMKPCSLA